MLDGDAHNIVRLDHPAADNARSEQVDESYAGAAALLDEWLQEGILTQDDTPSIYVVEHEFASPWREETSRRLGVLHRLRRNPGRGADQTARADVSPTPSGTGCRFCARPGRKTSPIFGLWNRGSGALTLLREIAGRPAQQSAQFQGDIDRETVRLWRVDEPSEGAAPGAAIGDSTLYIADGHHRYETAVAYAEERAHSGDNVDAAQVLTYLTAEDDPGLFLFWRPIVSCPLEATSLRTVAELRTRLDDLWQVTETDERSARDMQRSGSPNVFAVAAEDGLWQLVAAQDGRCAPFAARRNGSARRALAGATPAGAADKEGLITYERDAGQAISRASRS